MSFIKAASAAAVTLLAAASANATHIVLAPVNNMTTGQYGDVYVQSLDLLAQCYKNSVNQTSFNCAWEGDFASGGLIKIRSSEGSITDQVLVMTGTNGNPESNYDQNTGPFGGSTPGATKVDNPFLTPGGNGAPPTFDMGTPLGSGNPKPGAEPGGNSSEFSQDRIGQWDASLKSLVNDYLGNSGLTFLFDNNQTGDAAAQYFWGQIEITDNAGHRVACYELNNTHVFGTFTNSQTCHDLSTWSPTFTPPSVQNPNATGGDFVSSGGGFCVNKTTGAAGPLTGPNNDPCGANAFYVTNNLGSNTAEFAAFVPDLNAHLASWAANDYYVHVNYKMRGLNDGNEAMWIPNGTPGLEVPEPAGIALVGLALAAAGVVGARRKSAAR